MMNNDYWHWWLEYSPHSPSPSLWCILWEFHYLRKKWDKNIQEDNLSKILNHDFYFQKSFVSFCVYLLVSNSISPIYLYIYLPIHPFMFTNRTHRLPGQGPKSPDALLIHVCPSCFRGTADTQCRLLGPPALPPCRERSEGREDDTLLCRGVGLDVCVCLSACVLGRKGWAQLDPSAVSILLYSFLNWCRFLPHSTFF